MMTPVKISLTALFCFVLFTFTFYAPAQDQDTKKKASQEKLDKFEKELEKEKTKEKPKESTVILQISVPKDCKITVNNKEVTYEKFEVLMEFAGSSFVVEEMAFRGALTAIKLRSKE